MAASGDLTLVVDRVAADRWRVTVASCPLPAFVGREAQVDGPTSVLRIDGDARPDVDALRRLGRQVRRIVLPEPILAAFEACRASSAPGAMRLGIVPRPPERALDLPFECLFLDDASGFVGLDVPILRLARAEGGSPRRPVRAPVRVVAVVAAPSDRAPFDAADEVARVERALASGVESGDATLEVLVGPAATREALFTRLAARSVDVLHFSGHGAFDRAGADLSRRPHICLVRPDGESDPVDADTLEARLRGAAVTLAVLAACSTAEPDRRVPDSVPAMLGLAQRLTWGPSGIPWVVAMQAPIQSPAATTFVEGFYRHLLVPGATVDGAARQARLDLSAAEDVGSPSWVVPVVYAQALDDQPFMRRRTSWVWFAPVVVALVVAALALVPWPRTVRGSVTIDGGTAGGRVELLREDDAVVASAPLEAGRFEVSGLPRWSPTARLRVHVDGYDPQTHQVKVRDDVALALVSAAPLYWSGVGQRETPRGWTEFAVDDGVVVRDGDQLKLSIVPVGPVHVYVVHRGPEGRCTILHPGAPTGGQRDASPIEVPADHLWITIVGEPGRETFYLFALSAPERVLEERAGGTVESHVLDGVLARWPSGPSAGPVRGVELRPDRREKSVQLQGGRVASFQLRPFPRSEGWIRFDLEHRP